jgi:hypothetical protein
MPSAQWRRDIFIRGSTRQNARPADPGAAMAENKTKPTKASVAAYLAAIVDPERRTDCEKLIRMMQKITQQTPRMWGPSIVGFGSYHYTYASGREGDACAAGFSSRKSDISVYLTADFPEQHALLGRLGRHKMGKACLSIRRLADVDLAVLEELIARSVAAVHQRYG